MKRISLVAKCLGAGGLLLWCLCSGSPVADGNSSQTGNSGIAITALSKTLSGTTTPGARVSVYSQAFRPYQSPSGFSDSATADDSGRFVLAGLPEGYLNLLVEDAVTGKTGYIPGIPVFTDSLFADTLDSLQRPGYLVGTATDQTGQAWALSYVFITGTPFYAVTKNGGEFLLGPLPAGAYTIGLYGTFKATVNGLTPAMSLMNDTATTRVYADSTVHWHP